MMENKQFTKEVGHRLYQRYLVELNRLARDFCIVNDVEQCRFWSRRPGFSDYTWLEQPITLPDQYSLSDLWYFWRSRRLRKTCSLLAMTIADDMVAIYQQAEHFGLSAGAYDELYLAARDIWERNQARAKKYLDRNNPALVAALDQQARLDQQYELITQKDHAALNSIYGLAMALLEVAYGEHVDPPERFKEAFLYPWRQSCLTKAASLRTRFYPARIIEQHSFLDRANIIASQFETDRAALTTELTELNRQYAETIQQLNVAIDDTF